MTSARTIAMDVEALEREAEGTGRRLGIAEALELLADVDRGVRTLDEYRRDLERLRRA